MRIIPKNQLMSLKEAKEFINFNIQEGVYAPEDFDGMSDIELRIFATHENDRAEWEFDSWRKGE